MHHYVGAFLVVTCAVVIGTSSVWEDIIIQPPAGKLGREVRTLVLCIFCNLYLVSLTSCASISSTFLSVCLVLSNEGRLAIRTGSRYHHITIFELTFIAAEFW